MAARVEELLAIDSPPISRPSRIICRTCSAAPSPALRNIRSLLPTSSTPPASIFNEETRSIVTASLKVDDLAMVDANLGAGVTSQLLAKPVETVVNAGAGMNAEAVEKSA